MVLALHWFEQIVFDTMGKILELVAKYPLQSMCNASDVVLDDIFPQRFSLMVLTTGVSYLGCGAPNLEQNLADIFLLSSTCMQVGSFHWGKHSLQSLISFLNP